MVILKVIRHICTWPQKDIANIAALRFHNFCHPRCYLWERRGWRIKRYSVGDYISRQAYQILTTGHVNEGKYVIGLPSGVLISVANSHRFRDPIREQLTAHAREHVRFCDLWRVADQKLEEEVIVDALWCCNNGSHPTGRSCDNEKLGRRKFELTVTQVSLLSRHLPPTGINILTWLITKDLSREYNRKTSPRVPYEFTLWLWTCSLMSEVQGGKKSLWLSHMNSTFDLMERTYKIDFDLLISIFAFYSPRR